MLNLYKKLVALSCLKSVSSLALFFVMLFFTACSISPTEREVTVSNVEITGIINNFVKVVDGTYKFTHNDDDAFITVKFELVEEPDKPLCLVTWNPYRRYPELKLNALDQNGQIFETGYYGFSVSKTELLKLEGLLSSKVGEQKSISFKWDYYGTSLNAGQPIFKNAASFEIIEDALVYCDSYLEMAENEEGDAYDDDGYYEIADEYIEDSYEQNTKASGENYDEVLDSYEKYVNNYISLLKKYQAGDLSALSDYMSMLENAQEYSQKLGNSKGELSQGQMKRFLDINTKFSKAMIDLSN